MKIEFEENDVKRYLENKKKYEEENGREYSFSVNKGERVSIEFKVYDALSASAFLYNLFSLFKSTDNGESETSKTAGLKFVSFVSSKSHVLCKGNPLEESEEYVLYPLVKDEILSIIFEVKDADKASAFLYYFICDFMMINTVEETIKTLGIIFMHCVSNTHSLAFDPVKEDFAWKTNIDSK